MPTAVLPTSRAPLPEELLQYLSLYRVVVCTTCRYAIQPKAIARHLKEIHRMKGSDRQPLMQHLEKFELAEHELVMQYAPADFPVPLLPVQSGLQCRSEDCAYLCVTEKRMRCHWLSVHQRQGLRTCDWQTAPLQTFFKGNLLRYFTGTPSGKTVKRDSTQTVSQNGPEEWTEHRSDASLSSTPTLTSSSRILNELDNSIMHHFTTCTWLTLATDEASRQMWRVIVPQLAYQHQFLMHALLACTALHMAYLDPVQHSEWTIKARTYQDHALPQFRAAIPRVESETCDAVIIFARLVSITAFALDEEKEDKLPSWLFFIRSGCTMLCDVWGRIGTGPIKVLAESWEVLVDISKVPHQPLLDYLLAIFPKDWPEEVRALYNDSALALARTFSCMYALDQKVTTLDVLRFWPIQNSADFATLLSQWHPGALILLAHYCIVMHRVGTRTWYLAGRAASILATVVRRLDVIWHRYIEWPLSEVGLLPSTEPVTMELPIASLTLSSDNNSSSLRGGFDC